jgi:hypothetical protein
VIVQAAKHSPPRNNKARFLNVKGGPWLIPPAQASYEDRPISLGSASQDSTGSREYVQHISIELFQNKLPTYVKKRRRRVKLVKLPIRKKIVDINYNSSLPSINQQYCQANRRADPLFFQDVSGLKNVV